jgi:ankyrin repeat protein
MTACQREAVVPPEQPDTRIGQTPLMMAARSSDLSSVRKLLMSGVDVNARDINDSTALHYAAASCGDVRVVKVLLASGADVNARNKKNVTPLLDSINMACDKTDITLILIQAGADVNVAESGDGDTALWIATTESSSEVVEELLKKGANPNAQATGVGWIGYTPLHMAALNGLTDRVQLLLQYGASVNIRNARGQTPLDVANKRSPETRHLLEEYSHHSN